MRTGQKTQVARRLRRNMTDAERMLWRQLRMRNLDGFKFRRQHPVGPYVVDFVCVQARLAVEVDGGQHAGSVGDARRDAFLGRHGFDVLRFWNNDVLANVEGVCDVIIRRLLDACPHPGLPPQAGEGARATATATATATAGRFQGHGR